MRYICGVNEVKDFYKFYKNTISKITIYDIKRDFTNNLNRLNNEKLLLSCNNSLYSAKTIKSLERKIYTNEKIINFIDYLINKNILGN